MKECKALPSNRRNLALQAYLIMPLYRIARYRLVALEILRNTPHDHLDHKPLGEVAHQLEELCLSIDPNHTLDKRTSSMRQLIPRLTGSPTPLATPSRKFIMEGQLSVVDKRTKQFYCFLFNDLLVRTKKKRKDYAWKGETPLGYITLVDLDDSSTLQNSFQLLSEDKAGRSTSIVLCAPTPAAKGEWVLAISLYLLPDSVGYISRSAEVLARSSSTVVF